MLRTTLDKANIIMRAEFLLVYYVAKIRKDLDCCGNTNITHILPKVFCSCQVMLLRFRINAII